MNNVMDIIKQKRIYFDGGMGSILQKMGLGMQEAPEMWNITHPEIIEQIHRDYLEAGANIITTNTFGINCTKYDDYEVLIKAAIECTKKATQDFKNSFVAFDIGPLGRFLEPIGDLPFEDAVEIFAKNIRVAKHCGVDLIIIETMTDSYETKAAVLATKENCNLPIFVTNAYEESGKMLTGASPEAMVAMLEGLGVSALGINCSLGPDKMIPLIKRFNECSSLPIIANPNAGIPEIINGKASYSLTPDAFADYCVALAQNGANILGGCCGTDPGYIRKVVEKTQNIPLTETTTKDITIISSYTHALQIGNDPIIVGERINPTGKPKLKQALRDNNMNYILELAINQGDCGAQILDINVGLPEIDEAQMLTRAIGAVQAISDIPLQIDSNNSSALESAMRIYNGKPLINSVNGDKESMEAIFPLIKKYGGTLIALTLDKNGIPETAEERVSIAKRIATYAKTYDIQTKDIIFDPLALTVATNSNNDKITLDTVKALHELGYKTSLGISNISFGMPNRGAINTNFFAEALKCRLSCAIINPSSKQMMKVYNSYLALRRKDISDAEFESIVNKISISDNIEKPQIIDSNDITLKDAIIKGLLDISLQKTKDALSTTKPLDIINCEIIPALNEVGDAFENHIIFLPQLLKSAECSSKAFALIKNALPTKSANGNSIIIATVKGDIHDIGKNIVKLLLESYGFTVHDLGKDISPKDILEAVKKYDCKLVALSALMTTTLPAMEETIKLLHSYDADVKIIVGGAVLTEEYAQKIDADAYGKDAMSAVRYAENYYKAI